jgi:hypothetical protein
MLRRAAVLAHRELADTERAFRWLGDGLITHVDDESLQALVDLTEEAGTPKDAEAVLSRALEEVFDGPLVRKLLASRAALRRETLDDVRGAADDLKRLHDLSPTDNDVMEELSGLYTELEDYRGMVQLFEDQILRGRDKETRVDLARKVALLWRDELDDPRETADAWRRVLRMKPGDDEATEGLAVAKQLDLQRKSLRPPGPNLAAAPPKPAVEDEPEEAEGDTEAARLDSAESESDAADADADADEGDTDDDGYSADAQEPEPTSEPPSLEALDSVRSGIAEDERDDDASDDDASHDDASHDDASHDDASHDDASHDD